MFWNGKPVFLRHPEAAAGAAVEEQAAAPAGGEPGAGTAPAAGEVGAEGGAPGPEGPELSAEQLAAVEQMIDRRTHRLGHQIKTLESQLADRQRKLAEHMSAEELRQMEMDEKEAALTAREAELETERRQRYATEAIVAAGLGQDSKNALRLREFVLAESEADMDKRVADFKALLQSYVAGDVQRIFQSGGRLPEGGMGGAPQANYDQKIQSAMQAGNMAEAAYWTRQKAEAKTGG